MKEPTVKITIDSEELDKVIEKANRLVELLREAQQIAGSLSGREDTGKGVVLSEKDLHCLARVLQGCLYMDGGMFCCCRYCLYQESCNRDAKEGKTYFTETVTKKLQRITGVYLGINTHNLEDKLLVNSFQATNRRGNMQ